jgi:nicotinate-nucleotide--dimethylbenzimidazole phosphoribosyltransferase
MRSCTWITGAYRCMRNSMHDSVTTSDARYAEGFPEEARRAVYDALALRRDVRHFDPTAIVDDATLERILAAGHLAPSVGFSQPWAFIVVTCRPARERIRESFLACRALEAARFPEERRAAYLATRLEGILDASLNLCVAVDLRPRPEAILGATVQPESVRASAICAVQNIWIAARVEGVGVGWVSIVEPSVLRAELALPAGVEPVAYLCMGRPVAFRARPMLEENGWLPRRALSEVIHRGSRFHASAPRPDRTESVASVASVASVTARFDDDAASRARAHHATLTKPAGSLGRLEELAVWLAGVRGAFPVDVPERAALLVFAADHGVAREAVSAYGSHVTAAMVANVMAGGAAVSVLAERYGIDVTVVDVGVAGDIACVPRSPCVPLVRAAIRAGTANLRREAAMSRRDAEEAIQVGAQRAKMAIAAGAQALLVGEIGIGNTTAGAALTCAFTDARADEVVGRGTGLDDDGVAHKTRVVDDALALHALALRAPLDPVAVMAALGGFELAAIAGALLEGARARVPVILDGFLTTAAALCAHAIEPEIGRFLLASHASAERGHARALRHLGLTPLLDLALRLGEGTGAILALDLLRTAITLQRRMATFATAGVVGRAGSDLPLPRSCEGLP